jgi:CheY-like chemotaxis protein
VVGSRRYVRVAGPFDGFRVGFFNTAVRIYDLSEGGCFVQTLDPPPAPGHHAVWKINVPSQGWVYLKGQTVYVKPPQGFAVSFIAVPAAAADRLRRGLLLQRELLPVAEQNRNVMLPACPRCAGMTAKPLGLAGSDLPWFTCDACQHVWVVRPPELVEDTAVPAAIPAPSEQAGTKQILIADDDGGVLRVLVKGLSGYRVLAARDVAEAWMLAQGVTVDLLITDYLMPDGTGEELVTKLRGIHPALPVLIVTGHYDMLDDEGFGWWKTTPRLKKPFTLSELRAAVGELIGPP